MCPAQEHFSFLTLLSISMSGRRNPLPRPDTGLSVLLYVMLSIYFFYFGMCDRKFVLCNCLVSVQVSAPYGIAGNTEL